MYPFTYYIICSTRNKLKKKNTGRNNIVGMFYKLYGTRPYILCSILLSRQIIIVITLFLNSFERRQTVLLLLHTRYTPSTFKSVGEKKKQLHVMRVEVKKKKKMS